MPQALDDRNRQQLLVYCAGVNDGLDAKWRSLPMWATGFRPEPWDPAAVILVGKLLSFGGLAVSQLQNERLIIELVHAGANHAALAELLAPRLDHMDFELDSTSQNVESSLRRRPASACRPAEAGGQQRLGGGSAHGLPAATPCWLPTRTWKSTACRPSGTRPYFAGTKAT